MSSFSDAQELWEAALGVLQLEVTRPTYETWLRGTWGTWAHDGALVVETPNPFVASWLEKRMYSLIRRTVEEVSKSPVEIRFRVSSPSAAISPPGGEDPVAAAADEAAADDGHTDDGHTTTPDSGIALNDRYTFSTFVVGKSNQLAHAAAQAVGEHPGRHYNPLFIYSDVGLGKTHLLHAIGHALQARSLSILYVSTEQFTNEFIKAIREGKTEAFRQKYRSVDALLMDDIHFISGKEQTQEGFFHTFNDLHNTNRQVVLTSDRPPRALALLEDRLRSRFEWGLIADMQPPDLETRTAILQQKAAAQPVSVPFEITDYLARKILKNIRELEGGLNRVLAYAELTGQPVTIELASQALADLQYGSAKPNLDPQIIITAVANYYEVDAVALTSNRRNKRTALARHVAMYLLRDEAELPVTEIGRLLGKRDHSTVINACGKVAYQLNVDPELRQAVIAIKDTLRETLQRLTARQPA